MYDYEAKENDELTLKVDDIVKDVTKLKGGWWTGILHGKFGYFPENFVKVIILLATLVSYMF